MVNEVATEILTEVGADGSRSIPQDMIVLTIIRLCKCEALQTILSQ